MARNRDNNTLYLVRRAIGLLESAGISVLLGGGWAEELHGIVSPRPHKDIDLFVLSDGLSSVDHYIADADIIEIPQKHLSHKRAYLIDGVMIETILVKEDENGFYSEFWDAHHFRWPESLETSLAGIRCLTTEALRLFRLDHPNRECRRP